MDAAFVPKGIHAVTTHAFRDDSVRIWVFDNARAEWVCQYKLQEHIIGPFHAILSGDGMKGLVYGAATLERWACMLDISDKQCRVINPECLRDRGMVNAAAFSQDGEWCVFACELNDDGIRIHPLMKPVEKDES